jgi:hypothetical protein
MLALKYCINFRNTISLSLFQIFIWTGCPCLPRAASVVPPAGTDVQLEPRVVPPVYDVTDKMPRFRRYSRHSPVHGKKVKYLSRILYRKKLFSRRYLGNYTVKLQTDDRCNCSVKGIGQ